MKFRLWLMAACLPFSLFASEPPNEEPNKDARQKKIAVIGAGIAGLTAAYRIHQKGHDVEVYEARNRVGGRIFSVKVQGNAAELGGQNLLDGGDAETIQHLVGELGLELENHQRYWPAYFCDRGEKIDYKALLKAKQFDPNDLLPRLQNLAERSAHLRDVLNGLLHPDDPLSKALAVRIAAWEGGALERLSPACVGTLYQQLIGGISATHPGSANGDAVFGFSSVKGGNSLIPQRLAETLGEKIHLNAPLAAVSKTASGSYELFFRNGQTAEADILVLALPASMYEEIEFEEGIISNDRLAAIQEIQYGEVTRIVAPFAEPAATPKVLFDSSMILLPSPSFRTFTIYCVGASSRFSPSASADPYRKGLSLLAGEWEVDASKEPVFARDELLASYDGPVAYSWPEDPYVKGSYSYIAAGQEEIWTELEEYQGEAIRSLFAPIENSLFFAGEHTTTDLDAIGTIDAACESGEKTARLILNELRNRKRR